MRKEAERTLQDTVSKNYGPLLAATTRINQVESELATLGAALRSLRVTLGRLMESADRAIKDRAMASGAGKGVIKKVAAARKSRRADIGRSVSSAAPAFIWAAPVTIADEMRERRFKQAALLVAEVRQWRDRDASPALYHRIIAEGSATPQGALLRAAERRCVATGTTGLAAGHVGGANDGARSEQRMVSLAAVGAGGAFSGGGFDDVVACMTAVEDAAVELCAEVARECLAMADGSSGSEGDGGLLAAVWGTKRCASESRLPTRKTQDTLCARCSDSTATWPRS